MKASSSDILLAIPHLIVYCLEGENDGLVATASAHYLNFKGVLRSSTLRGISHSDIVDYRRKDYKGFDVISFYIDLVADLKDRGF